MSDLPPSVRSPRHWLLGTAYYVQRDPLHWITTWAREYGDIFRITSPLGQATVITRPEWARHVLVDAYRHYQRKSRAYAVLKILFGNGLVTSEGEYWRGQRKLIQPAFHRRRLEALFAMMVQRAEACAAEFAGIADTGKALDVGPALSRVTLDIIARAMFGTDVEGKAAEVGGYIASLNEYALRMLRRPALFLLPRSLPTPFNHRQVHALRSLNRIVLDIIQTRRRHPGNHDDLLAMLLNACEEGSGRGMTDDQLRDEVMTIFVAGHETTANAMSWLLFLLSNHPDVEARVVAELHDQTNADTLQAESLWHCVFTRQTIDESLRLYPSIWSVGRQCTESDTLGGYHIPRGMNVVIPIAHYHWNERHWPDARRFDPERFAPERRPDAESMIYFPFGAGPRSCIGNHFALQELMILTAVLCRRFAFRLEPGFDVEPEPLVTLRPKHGMRMLVSRRRALGISRS